MSSVDKALEECDMPCVPEFTKNTNNSTKKQCDASQLTAEKCYLEKQSDKVFYENINWTSLKANLDAYMTLFCKQIMEQEDYKDLREDIYQAYGVGPTSLQVSVKEYAAFQHKIVNNDDYKQCDNILLKFILKRGNVPGKQVKEIAHISLHPIKPKYYRNSRRSRSGCGYYCKLCANASSNASQESSAFHYVIDSLNFETDPFEASNKFRPELALVPNTLASFGGKFMPLSSTDKFPQIFMKDFTDGRNTEGNSQKLTPTLKNLLNSIHIRIYTAFVNFWNTSMINGIQTAEVTIPSIKKTQGGRRKTHKRKYFRNKSRKH